MHSLYVSVKELNVRLRFESVMWCAVMGFDILMSDLYRPVLGVTAILLATGLFICLFITFYLKVKSFLCCNSGIIQF